MKRRLTTVLLAVILAAAGTAAVYLYAHSADQRALAGKKAVEVLVAAKAIPAGTAADSLQPGGYLRSVRMPAETVPGDVMASIGADQKDQVVGTNILAGELLRRTLLVPRGRSQAFTVPENKIAVTIALTDPQRVAGYVQPGAKVAVFLSYKLMDAQGKVKGDATGTKLLMSGIEVLSVGPSAGKSGETPATGNGADGKNLVTLGVTQHQAEQLILGAQGGSAGGQGSALYLGLQTDSSQLNDGSGGASSFTLFH